MEKRIEGQMTTPEGKLIRMLYPVEGMCAWKNMVKTIVSPEGRLNYCKYHCEGLDSRCSCYESAYMNTNVTK